MCIYCKLFQVLKLILMKNYEVQVPVFLFLVLHQLLFTSVDIIFYKFLELHSNLSAKIFLLQIFFC